jgi:REP element-mobilizing transposase RayT
MAPDSSPERPPTQPYGYLLTISCYGARLHGDPRGSIDRRHNAVGTSYVEESSERCDFERRLMKEPPYLLSEPERHLVLEEAISSCTRQGWGLHAAHVRSKHIHIVLTANESPETVMGKLKTFLSRALNDRFGKREKRWARHGSTLWLWTAKRLDDAVRYVVLNQGSPMQLYVNPVIWPEYLDSESP